MNWLKFHIGIVLMTLFILIIIYVEPMAKETHPLVYLMYIVGSCTVLFSALGLLISWAYVKFD